MKVHRIFISGILILISFALSGQYLENTSARNYSIVGGLVAGVNYSWFKNSIGNYSLWSPEVAIGVSFKKRIKEIYLIQAQFLLGEKLSRLYDDRNDISGRNTTSDYTENIQYVFTEVVYFDHILDYNHFYIELPIEAGIKLNKRSHFTLGTALRFYPPLKEYSYDDFLKMKLDYSLITGMQFELRRNLVLEIDMLVGLNNIHSKYILIGGGTEMLEYSSTLKSRSLQLKLVYEY